MNLPKDYNIDQELTDEELITFPYHERRCKDSTKHKVVPIKSRPCSIAKHAEISLEDEEERTKGPKRWYWCVHTYREICNVTDKKRIPKKGHKCIAKIRCNGDKFENGERTGRCRQCRKPIFGEKCIAKYYKIYPSQREPTSETDDYEEEDSDTESSSEE